MWQCVPAHACAHTCVCVCVCVCVCGVCVHEEGLQEHYAEGDSERTKISIFEDIQFTRRHYFCISTLSMVINT